ncbi:MULTISPECIES: hypothetical protein [Streptomyces]|uniref:DUF3168 domain-containing protein n=1 Tax=Streptomyces lateritius TaxID=67313 RepID=A0ABW6YA83_9ACTN|nr:MULTISPECIES: hypothetical protein [Streptomyces]QGZ50438.1 hypothetical protein GPZ77_20555 [Streptomyces sp. QHH-9511]GGT88448.1 hypothetical protein GCM10010272_36590 [Streptomyces lateritius]
MTTPPSAFPDVEKLVVDVLKADPALAGATVAVHPPTGFDGTQSVVLVNRRGGAWIGDLHVDMPVIEFEVYGPSKNAAHTLANAARKALLATIGKKVGSNVFHDVEEQDGPRWTPDYLYRGANRYVCLIRVSVTVF